MTLVSLIPVIAAVLFLVATFVLTTQARPKHRWLVPAAASVAFFIFSLYTIAQEGFFGFWVEHTKDFWGNQIWMDLLLAATAAFVFLAPRAKAVGMRPRLWLLFIISTGSIGIMAMVARLIYLEDRAEATNLSEAGLRVTTPLRA